MGNAVPRNMRHEAAAKAKAAGESRSGSGATPTVPSGRKGTTASRHGAAWGRRGVKEQQAGGGGGSNVVMTVKVVVTRKEAEKLIAQLEEQNARQRKARIAELTGQLRAADGATGGRSPGGAWAPSLDAIQEN